MANINELLLGLLSKASQGIGATQNMNPTSVGAAAGRTDLSSNFGADLLKQLIPQEQPKPALAPHEQQAFMEGRAEQAKKMGKEDLVAHVTGQPPKYALEAMQKQNEAQGNGQPQLAQAQPQASPSTDVQNPQNPQMYQNPFGNSKGEQLSNFLQTMLTIGTGGIVPTPGYIKGMNINGQNAQMSGINADVEKQKRLGELPISRSKKEELALTGFYDLQKALATTKASKLIDQENKISDTYDELTKDFGTRSIAFQNVSDLIKDGNENPNGATDLALAYEFIRLQDPNAVKEGEIKNLDSALPFLSKYGINGVKVKSFKDGRRFDSETRDKILRASTIKYNAYAKQNNETTQRVSEKLKAYGGSPKRALINKGLPNNKENASVSGMLTTPSGIQYRKVS